MTTKKANWATIKKKAIKFRDPYRTVGPHLVQIAEILDFVGRHMEFYSGFGEMGHQGRELIACGKKVEVWIKKAKKRKPRRRPLVGQA
jgi:hypothetical protein